MAKNWIGAFRKFQTLTLGHFEMGAILFSCSPSGICTRIKNPGFFYSGASETMILWLGEAWDPESEALPCTRIKISREF